MADVFRGPLVQPRKERSDITPAGVVPNLLITTLAVAAAALPFNNSAAFPRQSHDPVSARAPVVNTARGTPVTLTPSVQTPAELLALSAPDAQRVLADTSRGSPLTLRAAAGAAPLLPAQWIPAPALARVQPATQAGSPPALVAQPMAAPTIPGPGFSSPAPIRVQLNTASGTPLTILQPPAQLPTINAPIPQVDARPLVVRNTSASSPLALLSPPRPVVPPVWLAAPTPRWTLADTTQESPQTLTSIVVRAVVNGPTPLADARPLVVRNTAASTPLTITSIVLPRPFFVPPLPAPERPRQSPETSDGMPLTLAVPLVLAVTPAARTVGSNLSTAARLANLATGARPSNLSTGRRGPNRARS